MRLIDGRIRLSIPGPARDVAYRIDGAAWRGRRSREPGEYRAALLRTAGRQRAGARRASAARAELANEGGRTPLRAGERAFARADAAPSYAYVFNSAALGSRSIAGPKRGATSGWVCRRSICPTKCGRMPATLDRYGYWGDEPTYGHVWYPRVAAGWRPYYRGRWSTLRPYGWTWVGYDPWGWPTHHYGRWGFGGAGWFWIPGRSGAPAWVSWASAPGYVSWCPLGWNNRPVFQINVYGGHGGYGYDPWRAWTVLPQRYFGVRLRPPQRRPRRPSRSRAPAGSFRVARTRADFPRAMSVPRATTAIRSAGTDERPPAVAGLFEPPLPTRGDANRGTAIEVPRGNAQVDAAPVAPPAN